MNQLLVCVGNRNNIGASGGVPMGDDSERLSEDFQLFLRVTRMFASTRFIESMRVKD